MTRSKAFDELRRLLGPKGYSEDKGEMEPWLTDWRGRFTGRASAMLSPGSTEEVAAIVTLCAREELPIVPQGGNSGMVGGATPDQSGEAVLLSMRRMNRIRSIDPDQGLAVAEAGVVLQSFHETLAEHDRRFPLTLGGKGSATIGGLVSTNAGGTQVLRHGTMRALVEGIEAVLPDGSVFHGLAPLKKDNRGYDLKHLLIGGEGTIGIVTAATLRTVPALIERAAAWIGLDSPGAAYRLLGHMERTAGQAMEGFEILPEICLASVVDHIPAAQRPIAGEHRWHVLIELVKDSPREEEPAELLERALAAAMEQGIIEDAALSRSEAQVENFWLIRDSIAEAERAQGPALQHDISVPVADMARFITEASREVERRFEGTQVIAFGHMGDGNIHFHVRSPGGADAETWYREQAAPISGFVYDLVEAAGGSISAEHGIGQAKIAELARLSDPARIAVLRAIKRGLDPKNIMNPGKLVPLARDEQAN